MRKHVLQGMLHTLGVLRRRAVLVLGCMPGWQPETRCQPACMAGRQLCALCLQANDGVCDEGRRGNLTVDAGSNFVACDLGTDCQVQPRQAGRQSSMLQQHSMAQPNLVCACLQRSLQQPRLACRTDGVNGVGTSLWEGVCCPSAAVRLLSCVGVAGCGVCCCCCCLPQDCGPWQGLQHGPAW